jgi:hypothetical protein
VAALAARARLGGMDELPFPIGHSPFHCKGVNYRNFGWYLDERLEGGREAFAARVRHPGLRDFFRQTFLAASWYDALPMVPLAHEAGRELHISGLQLARELARFGVKRDAGGIYKLLFKLTSPESMLERTTHTARQYFDFVTSEVERQEPQVYRLRHSGIPAFSAPVYMSLVEGFVETALGMAGAREVRQRWEKPVPTGTVHGVPVVRLEREIRWS